MTPVAHSFIDIAVLEGVRARMAAGEALVALDIGLERVIWANGPGAELIGFADVESVMGVDSGLSAVARRQIASVPGFPRMPRPATASVRLPGAARGQPLSVVVESLTMPDGEPAVLLVQPVAFAGSRAEAELAALAVSGFSEAGYFAALVRADATVAAASDGFDGLRIAPSTIAELVEEVRTEEDRLVKRPIPSGSGMLVAGIARLVDDPASHLLLAAPAEDEEPPVAPEEEAEPPIGEADQTAEAEDATNPAPEEETVPEPTAEQFAKSGEEPADSQPSRIDPAEDAAEVRREPEIARSAQAAIRFVWRTDAESRFTMVSAEFAEAVGTEASALEGCRFQEVAEDLGIDTDGEISGLLKRRDTWSGRTVMWPIAGGDLRVPVDLAALPIYDRLRRFEGFRGFGVARMAEAVSTPRGTGSAEPESPAPSDPDTVEPAVDPFEGEKPAIAVAAGPDRRQSDKVIRLAERRPPEPGDEDEETGLSASERHAFREIGNRLKLDDNGREIRDEDAVPEAVSPEEGGGKPSPGLDEISDDAPRLVAPNEALGGEDASEPEDEASRPADDVHDGSRPPVQPALADEATAEPDEMPATLEALDPFDAPDDPGIVPSALAPAAAGPVPVHPMTALLGGLPVPLLVHSGERLHFANREFLKLTGYPSIEAIAEAGGLEALFLDGGDPNRAGGQMRLRSADGGAVPVSAHLQSVSWADGKALLLVLLPVPTQAREEDGDELLAARLAEMRTIVDTATDGVVLIDNDGTIRSLSRPAEALFGMDSVEVEGQPFGSLFAMESRRSAEDYLSGLADNGVASVLNDGREVIGREAQGRFIPLFMTIGRMPGRSGFCAVLRDITSWKRAEDELNRARTQAEQASSQKTEFLARVSHEVRTPLNAIIGFSELMLDEKFGPIGNDRYRDYLRDINRSGNHVLDLVNDLLDISKIEAGEQEMSYEAVALNEALAETVAMMQPQANRERVIIRSSFASGLPDVVADLRSVRQIALNLLSNAIRHTPAGGQVIVSTAYEASGDIVARVRDTGIGMTLGEIEQALKPFKQVNALKRARGDGTGLGLPLTKAMVEANRARFSISSSPSQGTLVEITFPSTRVLAD